MNPQVFGWQHLIYIAVSILVAIAVFICNHKFAKTEKQKDLVIKISGAILFIIIFVNRIALVFEFGEIHFEKLIPDTLCSLSSFVISLAILLGKKDNSILQFIWLISFAGGVVTTFYPNFIGQNPSFLYPSTILGMMHHTWSAIVVGLLLVNKYVVIDYKRWRCTLFGFTCYLAYGAFLLCVLKFDNPLYMTGPMLDGTIFTVWVVMPIYIVVYSLILLVVELLRRKKLSKK